MTLIQISQNYGDLVDESTFFSDVPKIQLPSATIHAPDSALSDTVFLPGYTILALETLWDEGIIDLDLCRVEENFIDLFDLVSVVTWGDKLGTVRKACVHQLFDCYVLRGLEGSNEGSVLAYGVAVPHWLEELDVGVVDGIWHLRGGDWGSSFALYSVVEQDLAPNHHMLRLCSKVNLDRYGPFYHAVGYRPMKRNAVGYQPFARVAPGRIDMVKLTNVA